MMSEPHRSRFNGTYNRACPDGRVAGHLVVRGTKLHALAQARIDQLSVYFTPGGPRRALRAICSPVEFRADISSARSVNRSKNQRSTPRRTRTVGVLVVESMSSIDLCKHARVRCIAQVVLQRSLSRSVLHVTRYSCNSQCACVSSAR
jgi:hypothetical protein